MFLLRSSENKESVAKGKRFNYPPDKGAKRNREKGRRFFGVKIVADAADVAVAKSRRQLSRFPEKIKLKISFCFFAAKRGGRGEPR